MTKEQAIEAYGKKWADSNGTISAEIGFIAGWEAHEAQCPGEAVATLCPHCNGMGKYEIGAWTSVNENNPAHWDNVLLRRIDSKDEIDFSEIAKFKEDCIEMESYNAYWGERIYHSNIEWSHRHESAPQVFTREQVSDAFHAGLISGLDSAQDRPFISQDEYMNINYPTK